MDENGPRHNLTSWYHEGKYQVLLPFALLPRVSERHVSVQVSFGSPRRSTGYSIALPFLEQNWGLALNAFPNLTQSCPIRHRRCLCMVLNPICSRAS